MRSVRLDLSRTASIKETLTTRKLAHSWFALLGEKRTGWAQFGNKGWRFGLLGAPVLLGILAWIPIPTRVGLGQPAMTEVKLKNQELPQGALLQAWRSPDPFGRTCSRCHAPDALDLAAYDFTPKDLMRRALRHLPEKTAADVVKFIEWRRQGLKNKLQNQVDCPMQPGGTLLNGATPSERDLAFLEETRTQIPLLFQEVHSQKEADALREELVKSDPLQMRVGLPMSRLSRDGYFRDSNAQVNEWLPENSIQGPANLNDLQSNYIEQPTSTSLLVILKAIEGQKGLKSEADELARQKVMAGLIFQHDLRMKEGLIPSEPLPVSIFDSLQENPFWEVGNTARLSQFLPIQAFGLAPDVFAEKVKGPPFKAQMEEMERAWLWLGFCFDPSLNHSGFRKDVPRAQYLVQSLLDQNLYPSHALYLLAKKTAAQFQDAQTYPSTAARSGFEFEFDPLIYPYSLKALGPSDRIAKSRFQQGLRSLFVASMYWQIESIRGTKRVLYPTEELSQLKLMAKYLKETGNDQQALVNLTKQTIDQYSH